MDSVIETHMAPCRGQGSASPAPVPWDGGRRAHSGERRLRGVCRRLSGLNCVSQEGFWKFSSSGPVNVILFQNRVFVDVIKFR